MLSCQFSRSKGMIILLICLGLTFAQWSPIGKSQSFTCVTPKKEGTIYWQLKNETKNESLYLCLSDNANSCSPYKNVGLENYNAINTSNSTLIITIFTIKYITPYEHNTTWFCNLNTKQETNTLIAQYDLRVFAPATNPTCDSVRLVNESSIQITCSTEIVFPESICYFYMNINGSSENILDQRYVNYKHDQNLTTRYYKSTCTFIGPVTILRHGYLSFRVVMYPNITSTITEEIQKRSEYTSVIHLAYPKVVLGTDCGVKGYIKENETSSCTCTDNSNSFLPTKIMWSTNQRYSLDKGTITFTAKRKGSFKCTITNHLNWTEEIVFHPNISYPPDTLSVNITRHVFDLCNDTNIAISGSCFVSESNPEPSVTVNINNSLIEITSLKNNREYTFNNTVTSAGIYYISCNANSIEYSTNASSITAVTIKGPPDIPTIFKGDNEENKSQSKIPLKITKEETITCQAEGGYPILKMISLTCGSEESHATNQDQVSLAFNDSNVTNGTCKCVVWHESVCLQNTSTIYFQVVVSENSPVSDQYFEKIYLGVGVAAGCFVLLIAFIFIVSNLRQGQFKKSSSGMAEKLVANEDIYFIKQEKSDVDMSIYPEYTNVVTTMSSAMEAPKNLKTTG